MSSLRQEYTKSKTRKTKIVSEAAVSWLSNNIILINEKIDRTTVSRLIDSIQKFEDTFGKFADRLPTIDRYLSAAEQGLQQVITGKANDRKASAMLKKLTILYFTFSDFFSRDLPVLLRARMFDAAKEQPDVRLDMLRNRNGAEHDPYLVRDALSNALTPTKDEKKLLSKIYRSALLPRLNASEIAAELMALTFNELQELTQVGRIPMVATPDELPGEEAGLENLGGLETPGAPPAAPAAPAAGAAPGITPPVPEAATKKGEVLTEEVLSEEVLREAVQLLSEAKIEELQGQVSNLKKLVDSAGLTSLKGKVDKLQGDLIQAQNSDAFVSYWDILKQSGGQTGGAAVAQKLKALFAQSPQAKQIANLLGRTNATIEAFKSIANAWPTLQKTVGEKETLTDADVANIEKILVNAAPKQKSGLIGVLGQALNALIGKGSTEPYITPQEIVDALLGELKT